MNDIRDLGNKIYNSSSVGGILRVIMWIKPMFVINLSIGNKYCDE